MTAPKLGGRPRPPAPRLASRLASPRAGRFSGFVCGLLVFLWCAPATVHAQPAATGIVTGRVQNAVTGDSLNNARVSVKGTNLVTFTDEGGHYVLDKVPAGPVTLRVFFTGLDEQDIALNVAAGQQAVRDVDMTSVARYGAAGDTVKLDAFVVQSTKETDAAAIAVNEQRTTPNISSVVSAEEFGTIVDRNPGELLKYLPGVDVDYFANNITGVSVHGMGSNNTELNFDGMPVASMNAEGVGRGAEVQYASAADIAYVKIHELPLPEDSANAIGGSIDMVRRSAFEYSKRKITYKALFKSDGEKFTFQDMDGPKDRLVPRWRPNWEVQWTEPVSRNFGFAVTAGQNDTVVNTHWSLPGQNYGTSANNAAAQAALAAGQPLPTVPSIYNPGLRAPLNHNAPKQQGKDYASARIDWRPSPELTLGWSLSGTKGWVQNADDIRYSWDAAATGSGNVTRYNDATTSLGRVGGGGIYHNSPLWRDVYAPSVSTVFDGRWRKGSWNAAVKAGWSESRYQYYDTEHGFFGSTTEGGVTGLVNIPNTGVGSGTANPIPLTVDFKDIDYWGPKSIQAWTTKTGAGSSNFADYTVPVDWASNAVTRIGGARARPGSGKEILSSVKSFLKHDFSLRNPLSLQLGLDYYEDFRNRHYPYYTWRFVGADGVPNSADDASTLIAAESLHSRPDSQYGYPGSERISMSKLYSLYQQHPSWFQYDEARSERLSRTNNPAYDLTEKNLATYAQFDWSLFENRLRLVGGVRYEKTRAHARGLLTDNTAAYLKYSDGSVVHVSDKDASGAALVANLGSSTNVNYQLVKGPNVLPATRGGAPIFVPAVQAAGNAARAAGETTDSGTNLGRGTLAQTLLVYTEKGATGDGENDGYYPSLNLNFDLTSNLVFQFGYARTQARLDYNSVLIPGSSRTDDIVTSGVGTGALGKITVHNTDLKPWTGDNYTARLSYYTNTGGVLGLELFTKDIKNIIVGEDTAPLTSQDIATLNAQYPNLDLGEDAVGYSLHTDYNEGDGRLDGAQLEMRQNLNRYLPQWARGFSADGSVTYTNRTGPNSSALGKNVAWNNKLHIGFNRRRLTLNVGYTVVGTQVETPVITSNGIDGTQVRVRQDLVDASFAYRLSKNLQLFIQGSNLLNEVTAREQRYPGSTNMTSSNTYGKTYTMGVTGSF